MYYHLAMFHGVINNTGQSKRNHYVDHIIRYDCIYPRIVSGQINSSDQLELHT